MQANLTYRGTTAISFSEAKIAELLFRFAVHLSLAPSGNGEKSLLLAQGQTAPLHVHQHTSMHQTQYCMPIFAWLEITLLILGYRPGPKLCTGGDEALAWLFGDRRGSTDRTIRPKAQLNIIDDNALLEWKVCRCRSFPVVGSLPSSE